jgi:hypothetical protein
MTQPPELVHRPYRQLVDNLLIRVAGGVADEEHVFDPRVAEYDLVQPVDPVRGIRVVTGVTDTEPDRTFVDGTDYVRIGPDGAHGDRLRWLTGGAAVNPVPGSVFQIDYWPVGARSLLTDLSVGSVVRTLLEAVARELAVVHAEINEAYRAGFIDHATGTSLDFVVALLDVRRRTADFAGGAVTFFRGTGTDAVTIPAGTQVTTDDGKVIFETRAERTLQPGQPNITVEVLATSPGEAGLLPAGAITRLVAPPQGIGRVTNADATVRPAAAETDPELRERAKAKLRGLNQATVAAIISAARAVGADEVELHDPMVPPDDAAARTGDGQVDLLFRGDPARFDAVVGAVDGTRAAGVRVTVVARVVLVTLRLQILLPPDVPPDGQQLVKQQVLDAAAAAVTAVPAGQPVTGPALRAAVATGLEVSESDLDAHAVLRDVVVFALDPDAVPPDLPVPRRDLLTRNGAPATDADIQHWDFNIGTELGAGRPALPRLQSASTDLDVVLAPAGGL